MGYVKCGLIIYPHGKGNINRWISSDHLQKVIKSLFVLMGGQES
jgi:hypothetical protein